MAKALAAKAIAFGGRKPAARRVPRRVREVSFMIVKNFLFWGSAVVSLYGIYGVTAMLG